MKTIFKRWLVLTTSISFMVLSALRCWNGSDEAPSPTTPELQPDPAGGPHPPAGPASEPAEPSTQLIHRQRGPQLVETQSRPAVTVTFSGTVVPIDKAHSRFALRETAGTLYALDSDTRALPWVDENVRITGSLDVNRHLLYVDQIRPALGRLMRRA